MQCAFAKGKVCAEGILGGAVTEEKTCEESVLSGTIKNVLMTAMQIAGTVDADQ